MAYGLAVWNASGVRTLSTQDRILRLHSTHRCNNATKRRYVFDVPGFRNNGDWVVVYFAPWLSFEVFFYANRIEVNVPFAWADAGTVVTASFIVLRT